MFNDTIEKVYGKGITLEGPVKCPRCGETIIMVVKDGVKTPDYHFDKYWNFCDGIIE
jgi:hypothetical protein